MPLCNKKGSTWIGNANSIVEYGKEKKYLFGDGAGEGVFNPFTPHHSLERFVNPFSLERFGDACLEGLDIPAWLEESLPSGPSTNPSIFTTFNTNVKSEPSPYVACQEHDYAIATPEPEHYNDFDESDNILPIIDDLLGNSQSYNLDAFVEESPLSSPGMLSSEEFDYQNLDELLTGPAPGIDSSHLLTDAVPPMSMDISDNMFGVPHEIANAFNGPPKNPNKLYAPPENLSVVLTDSGVNSPSGSYMSQLLSDDSYSPDNYSPDNYSPEPSPQTSWCDGQTSPLASSGQSSPLTSLYDGQNHNLAGQSQLVQLLLSGFNDQSVSNEINNAHSNLFDDKMSTSSAASSASNCGDDELNRILDGGYSRPRSVSSSSTSSQNNLFRDDGTNNNGTNNNGTNNNGTTTNGTTTNVQQLHFSEEAVVPSIPPSDAAPARKKSARMTTSKKNQKRFEPYIVDLKIVKADEDSNDNPTGRKVYKTKEAKDRKMSQNRTAAVRYRQKKKNELTDMEQEADGLEETNGKLKTKVEDMRREIDYLKNLMMDVIKAKLSVNSDAQREETLKLLDELTSTEVEQAA